MVMQPGLSGILPQHTDKRMDDTAADVAKALFLAGKIKCDCEVCRLLVAAGAKMVSQLAAATPPPAGAPAVTPAPVEPSLITGE
jgi:hypothetical protein